MNDVASKNSNQNTYIIDTLMHLQVECTRLHSGLSLSALRVNRSVSPSEGISAVLCCISVKFNGSAQELLSLLMRKTLELRLNTHTKKLSYYLRVAFHLHGRTSSLRTLANLPSVMGLVRKSIPTAA